MSVRATLHIARMFARMIGRVPTSHLLYLLRRMRFEKPHAFAGQTRINTFFPPYPSQAFDRFCRAVIDRSRTPYSTYVAVTGRCPFHCAHCSYAGRRDRHLDTAQMLDVIEQVKRLGTCTLGFTGGEPLLRDDLEAFIRAAAPEMACVLFTTGYGLDRSRAASLAAAGVTCVTIGLESEQAAVHDAVRDMAGSFGQAQQAAEHCRTEGIYTAISTIATRERLSDGTLDRMYQLGCDWGMGEFRILAPVATGAWAGCGAAMLNADELRQLRALHIAYNKRRSGPAVACFAYLESEELFGCGAGFHHLFIDADGEVCPCDLTPMSFGSVRDESLVEIWRRMGAFFPTPRCGCLMNTLADRFERGDTSLPLPRERSEQLCASCTRGERLPEGYRRLLKKRP